jgi:hypothetical protein
VASDGDTAFAVWTDTTACYSPCSQLFGTPLDRNGMPLTPSGILLTRQFGTAASIAWNGRSYVVVAYAYGMNNLASFLIARDGTLLRGNELLLAGNDLRGQVVAFLDADARPAPRVRLSLYPVTFIHDGTNWIGVATRLSCGVRCTYTATRIRIRAQGLAVDERLSRGAHQRGRHGSRQTAVQAAGRGRRSHARRIASLRQLRRSRGHR